jgi:hypothetical protein
MSPAEIFYHDGHEEHDGLIAGALFFPKPIVVFVVSVVVFLSLFCYFT